jgi:hypothetical protein
LTACPCFDAKRRLFVFAPPTRRLERLADDAALIRPTLAFFPLTKRIERVSTPLTRGYCGGFDDGSACIRRSSRFTAANPSPTLPLSGEGEDVREGRMKDAAPFPGAQASRPLRGFFAGGTPALPKGLCFDTGWERKKTKKRALDAPVWSFSSGNRIRRDGGYLC